MNFKIQNTLINEAETPQGLLYRMIIVYTCIAVAVVFIMAIVSSHHYQVNFYFVVNFFTVLLLAWFIRKSFNILSSATYVATFRIGLFLLLNSTLVSMAGGLNIMDKDTTSIVAALLYAPAIVLIINSFNRFINFVNTSYQSAVALSLTDELTGLPNRRHLNLKLREIESQTGTLCIADIDHFKKINDTYGHETGDKVLIELGHTLSGFSNENVFIARSGGEEFCIVITGDVVANNIIGKIKSSITGVCNGGINVTISAGVAVKKAGETSSEIITKADAALYRAKKMGRARVVYDS